MGIVGIALLLRLPMLFTQPSLSDDVWRYLHDGRAQLTGMNPYVLAPGDERTAPFRGPEFTRINHRDLVTIYPPAAQLAFASNALLGSRLLIWRLLLIAAELATFAAIAGLLARRGHGSRNLALYAWHPLAVIEAAGSAHLDPIAIALLVAGVLAAERGRAVSAGVLLGFSTAFKLVTAPLLAATTQVRQAKVVIPAILCVLVLYGLYWQGGPPIGSLPTFAVRWEGNASAYAALASLTDGYRARIFAVTLLLCAIVVIRSSHMNSENRMAACMLAILLLSPVVHPWYLLWLLALVPVVTERWLMRVMLVWSVTVPVSYLASDFRMVEYAPVYAMLALTAVTAVRRGFQPGTSRPLPERTQQIPT
jgi:hypothetical protein